MRGQFRPQDLLVVLDRARFDHADYDLLFFNLEAAGFPGLKAVLPDYVDPLGPSWPQALRRTIDDARRRGGAIWVSEGLFDARWSTDLSHAHDPFAIYPSRRRAGIDGPALRAQLAGVFADLGLMPSGLRVAEDRLLKVRVSLGSGR